MPARPPGLLRRTAALLADPRSRRLIRLLVAVALLAAIWAAERRAGVRESAPGQGKVEAPDGSGPPRPANAHEANDETIDGEESPPLARATQAADAAGEPTASGADSPPTTRRSTPMSPPSSDGAGPLVIDGLSLRDSSGRVIYRGRIDLAPTIERISTGRKLRFPNDGTTFQNRENRLPRRPPGYYREWVVPTPKESGPGPQRLITGDGGEVWYTPDHYRSFRRIPTEKGIR